MTDESKTAQGDEIRAVEAAGITVDFGDTPDMEGWRPIGGSEGATDLTPLTSDRMRKRAFEAWERNLIGNRIIELALAYIAEKGVSIKSTDDEAQQALNAHWEDGLNAWEENLVPRLRLTMIAGEALWPVFPSKNGRFMRLGNVSPTLIAKVVTDPDNDSLPIAVQTKRFGRQKVKRYRIIHGVAEDQFGTDAQAIRAKCDGEAFYFRLNYLPTDTRGRSDLLQSLDWFADYENFLTDTLDRIEDQSSHLWDVTMKGLTPEQIKVKAKEIEANPPVRRSARVHNENEIWAPLSPNTKATDNAETARMFKQHILSGSTMPPGWFSDGVDTNRANGQSMAEPTEKVLGLKQKTFGHMLLRVARHVLRCYYLGTETQKALTPQQEDVLRKLRVEWPNMVDKDITKFGSVLQQVISAVVQALTERLISRELALRMIEAVASELGVEIDVKAELKKAQEENARENASDTGVLGNDE